MASEYEVQRGDSLSKIARDHGLPSWREIYFYKDNEPFRRLRPNPNLIYPGDRLLLPDPTEMVALPTDATSPQYLRLPWSFATRLNVPRLVSLVPSLPPSASVGQSGSQLIAQLVDPSRVNSTEYSALVRPRQRYSQCGVGMPRPTGPCRPWGRGRGPFDLDQPRPGYFGDLTQALQSVPQVGQSLGDVGDFLWSNAPPGRRAAVLTTGATVLGGAVTAFATSDSFRNFALERLNDVDLPVGEAILLIPGLGQQQWVQTVLRPLKFSLIWQEPGPVSGPNPIGTPRGFQGTGGLLILDLQDVTRGEGN